MHNYALNVSQALGRFHSEAARSAPPHETPKSLAWSVFQTAVFEADPLPHIRLEMIREKMQRSPLKQLEPVQRNTRRTTYVMQLPCLLRPHMFSPSHKPPPLPAVSECGCNGESYTQRLERSDN